MWTTELLSQVATIVSGNSVPAKKKEALFAGVEGMPYVATKDISYDGAVDYDNGICIPEAYLSEFRISPIGATLICAEGGSAGRKIAYSSNECCYVNKLVSLQPNQKIAPKFLYYYALNSEFQSQFKAALHGLIGGVSLTKMKKFYISYPPLAEQQRIVAKLDAAFAEIDTAIAAAEAKEAEVEKLKASLLSASLSSDAEVWKTVKLEDVCELQPAKRQVRQRLTDEDSVSFMPMDCLGVDEIYPRAEKSKTLLEVYSSYTYFEDKDVLLAKITPCFENGKLGIANNLVNGVGFGSSEYIVLRCGGDILPEYVYYHLSQISFRFEGKNNMSGAVGHKRVPKEFVANREIPLPPLAEQQRIVAKLDAAFAEMDGAKQAIQRAKENHAALKAAILAQELTPPSESEAA